MSTKAPVALAGACPDAEQLAAYVDGMLTPAERTAIEQHLSGCAECRDVVGDSAAAAAESGATVTTPRRRPRAQWMALTAILATAAAALLVVQLRQPSAYYVPELAALARVETPSRPLEARLSGGFRYAPPPLVTRGAPDARNLELIATADKVRAEIGDRAGADADAARSVTFLIGGDAERAVAGLERATASGSAPARMWSDLAAAYLARGRADDPPRAVAAAERALQADGSLREAAFNRALALERAGRAADALQAWRDYAASERDAQWAAEAQRHVARLSGSA